MVVDQEGRFLSQRTHPEMALTQVAAGIDAILVTGPKTGSVSIPFVPPSREEVRVTIWKDEVHAVGGWPEADRWFSEYLGIRCRLVMFSESSTRNVDSRYATQGEQTSFSDAFPFLLMNEASLQDLNRRIGSRLAMDRFRPNIVVNGCEPYAEDDWNKFRINTVSFQVAKPCARCVITTIDQSTGKSGAEPLKTLATYRTKNGKILFGQNLIHGGAGHISVGDAVVFL